MANLKAKGAVAAAVLAAAAIAAPMTIMNEGWANKPYKDVGGVWTVCAGDTHDVDPNHYYTDTECMVRFIKTMGDHAAEITPYLPENMPQGVRAVMIDVGVNIGPTNFKNSTMSKKALAGDFAGACRAITLWTKAGGKDCHLASSNCYGIVIRRNQERADCLKALGIVEK
jgi:lysozyme